MRIPRGLRDLTPPPPETREAQPIPRQARLLWYPHHQEGLKRSGVTQSAGLRFGFQREATRHFLALFPRRKSGSI